tara:strand:- start:512 stop:934 length:423 start_codon:yes stop_codon:yes gene_type:complete
MFSQAYTDLNRALRMAQSQNKNFHTIRDNLNAAKSAVLEDVRQPPQLREQAAQYIDRAISYTYSRTNPMPAFSPQTFSSMTTPISPFQTNRQGPYGFVVGPMVPGHPELVPTQWTADYRESNVLIQMIREALMIVKRGLH